MFKCVIVMGNGSISSVNLLVLALLVAKCSKLLQGKTRTVLRPKCCDQSSADNYTTLPITVVSLILLTNNEIFTEKSQTKVNMVR